MSDKTLGGQARVEANTSPEATATIVTDRIAKKGLHAVEKNTSRLEKLVVEYVGIDEIKPNTYNPNRQDESTLELLCRSIKEDGVYYAGIGASRDDADRRWRASVACSAEVEDESDTDREGRYE